MEIPIKHPWVAYNDRLVADSKCSRHEFCRKPAIGYESSGSVYYPDVEMSLQSRMPHFGTDSEQIIPMKKNEIWCTGLLVYPVRYVRKGPKISAEDNVDLLPVDYRKGLPVPGEVILKTPYFIFSDS